MKEDDKYKFSIVIPTYNEENYILNCLSSIENQNYERDLIEIIIVDGNSTDKTLNLVEGFKNKHNSIKIFQNPEKKTPKSLNIGIRNATGDVIVILGAHTRLDENFLYYNNKFLHEKDVEVSGGTQINTGINYIQNAIGIAMEMPFAMASAEYRWSKTEKFVDTVVYGAYKREVFDEIGYFEENFTISEDAELNWRIRQKGHKIFYSPKIKSYYYPRASLIKFIKQMFRYGILRVNVLKKHIDSIKLFHIIPSFFVITLIGLIILTMIGYLDNRFLLLLLFVYFSVNIISSFIKTFPQKLVYLPILPLFVFLMHFFWGLGFIVGLILPKSAKW